MKTFGQKQIETVTDVICNVCKNSCVDEFGNVEYCSMFASWGFSSNKDCQTHSCDLCESCYDKVAEFIRSLGGEIEGSLWMGKHISGSEKIYGEYIGNLYCHPETGERLRDLGEED
jgi:hypothetical protein